MNEVFILFSYVAVLSQISDTNQDKPLLDENSQDIRTHFHWGRKSSVAAGGNRSDLFVLLMFYKVNLKKCCNLLPTFMPLIVGSYLIETTPPRGPDV